MDRYKRLAITYPDEYHASVVQLIEQSRRCVRIWSTNLEPPVYNKPAVQQALSSMVRRNRNAEARLLVADASGLVKSGHCLVALMRQLPSAIKIRQCLSLPDRYRENFIVADFSAIAAGIEGEDDKAFVNFSAAVEAKDRARHFDYLWERSQENPELRALAL